MNAQFNILNKRNMANKYNIINFINEKENIYVTQQNSINKGIPTDAVETSFQEWIGRRESTEWPVCSKFLQHCSNQYNTYSNALYITGI